MTHPHPQFLALFCFMCGAPGYEGPQHWFLLVAALCFLGTIFFSLYYLCLAEPLNKLGVNWLMGVSWQKVNLCWQHLKLLSSSSGVLVYSRRHLCLLHRLRGDARQLQRQRRPWLAILDWRKHCRRGERFSFYSFAATKHIAYQELV